MKQLVDVLMVYARNGAMIPKEIYLDDELTYVIDQVKKSKR